MKTKLLTLYFLAAFSANAQIYYNFGTNSATSAVTSGVPEGWTASSITRVGLRDDCTECGSTSTTNESGGYEGASGRYNYSMNPKVNTSYESYVTFTITPAAGQIVGITNISMGARSTSVGPGSLAIRTNLDNFSEDLASADFVNRSTWELKNFDFPGEMMIKGASGQAIEVRIYLVGTGSSASPSLRLDDIRVTYDATLPVSLTAFSAMVRPGAVLLNWQTVSEQNNSHFEVLRSADGRSFEPIGRVSGAGNSVAMISYQFEDTKALAGTSYYQLKQVDFDGRSTLSSVVPVKFSLQKTRLSAYSSDNQVRLNAVSGSKGKGAVTITNMNGSTVAKLDVELTEGENTIILPVALQPGMYVASLSTAAERLNVKFVK